MSIEQVAKVSREAGEGYGGDRSAVVWRNTVVDMYSVSCYIDDSYEYSQYDFMTYGEALQYAIDFINNAEFHQ